MALWNFDSRTRRYRVTADGAAATGQPVGTFVGQARMTVLRDSFIAEQKVATNLLAEQVANGNITIQQWTTGMRQVVKDSFIDQYTMAAGGRNSMTQADWGRVGRMVRDQYQYLDGFASDIASGRYTENGVAARARMYAESSSQAFERGNAVSRGMPDLPAYPGDGKTQCLSNCKCSWVIKETDTAWECTWKLNPAEHCEDCIANSERWAPLIISKANAANRTTLAERLNALEEQ